MLAVLALGVGSASVVTATGDRIDGPATIDATAERVTPPALPSSATRRLSPAFTVSDPDLQPKSVVAAGGGLFFTQNMMYRHNVAVFDRNGAKVATIPDRVDLAEFGVPDGVVADGSPVEAAVTPDGRFVYVSNYKMYGPGFDPSADDDCSAGAWDDSYVYKIDVESLSIVDVIPTGAVPKHLAVSPDGETLVIANWCGFDATIVDTATDTALGRVPLGRHPRGVAITNDSRYAFVAIMGGHRIDVIDLDTRRVVRTIPTALSGTTPRHLVLSPDGDALYVSNNQANTVRRIDLRTNTLAGVVSTGTQTRTMALSDDGDSLYVVNYVDGTVSKVRTADMAVLQTEPVGYHPVGVTYDPESQQVWVANYGGTLTVFTDT